MTCFYSRPAAEQATITSAYQFEVNAIASEDLSEMAAENPYADTIKAWPDGAEIWEAIGQAVEMAFGR